MDAVYFLLLVVVLVFVHEFGHFAVAKFFDVQVLCFSIGLGPRLLRLRLRGTEYRLALFPIGGYVKMLGEDSGAALPPETQHRAFCRQALYKRMLIVLAGPLLNLAFAALLLFAMFLKDSALSAPIVGDIAPDGVAAGSLKVGDRIVAVDGRATPTFRDVTRLVASNPGRKLAFDVERDGRRMRVHLRPKLTAHERELGRVSWVGRVGIRPHHRSPVVGVADAKSPAALAGLQSFDEIVAVGTRPVRRLVDLERAFADKGRGLLALTYLRPQPAAHALPGLGQLELLEAHLAAVVREGGRGPALAQVGIDSAELYVRRVKPASPEARMGLRPGDRLLSVDAVPLASWPDFLERLRRAGQQPLTLRWQRGAVQHAGKLRVRWRVGTDEHGAPFRRLELGMQAGVPRVLDPPAAVPHPLRYAAGRAVERSAEMVSLTVYSLLRMLQGRLSVRALGGPITLFDAAGKTARDGLFHYLTLLAFLSVNLALLNLLPIPLLDGGQLTFLLIEGITRRRIHTSLRDYAAFAGLSFLILLTALAVKNDVERQWPRIVDQILGD
ncbi:MAG: site-2 protease family protein [Polyangiales bacterium]